jgi:hypothetical protein
LRTGTPSDPPLVLLRARSLRRREPAPRFHVDDVVEKKEVLVDVTYKSVQEKLRDAGIVISKRGDIHRINFFGGLESTAYYTESLEDALERGLSMAKNRHGQS